MEPLQGRIQDFKLGGEGAHLIKLRRAEGGAKNVGVFRVKNAGCALPPGSAPALEIFSFIDIQLIL